MKRKSLFLLFFTLAMAMFGNNKYETQSLQKDIKSLQIKVNSNPLAVPIIRLESNERLDFFFDQMSHETHSYSYQVVHCNADWTESDLSSGEYIDGFDTGYIDDYETSINTTFLYTNYTFQLPNDNSNFKISGNYAVKIFEDNDNEKPICVFTFCVLEEDVSITGKIHTNTEIEINGGYQQLDFDIFATSNNIQDANRELIVTVQQNGRKDNMIKDIKPTFFSGNKLRYKNNPKLIFEAGNEYLRFDISSRHNYDERINKIEFIHPHFNAFLTENHCRANRYWQSDEDVNGKFIINFSESYDGRTEADYYYVHFSLHPEDFLPKGEIYIGGYWNENRMNSTSKMSYNESKGIYQKTLLLKQGAYNYNYWFLPHNSSQATLKHTDGNFWQTDNEYIIYVYQRPFGGRYDKLVGFKVL